MSPVNEVGSSEPAREKGNVCAFIAFSPFCCKRETIPNLNEYRLPTTSVNEYSTKERNVPSLFVSISADKASVLHYRLEFYTFGYLLSC